MKRRPAKPQKINQKLPAKKLTVGSLLLVAAFLSMGILMHLSSAASNSNLKGELDGDNKVTITDLSILLRNWNKTSDNDLNGDGTINVTDLSLLLSNWGKIYTPGPTPTPSPAPKRGPMVSPAGGLGQYNLSSKSYIMGFRFILDDPTSIDRWYFAINGEGSSCVGGRSGYGSGNGGQFFGRIVEVNQSTGLPGNTILAQESVNGCTSYQRAKNDFNLDDMHQLQYIQFPSVSLQAGKMYAFLLSNTDSNPGNGGSSGGGNNMSPNLNFTLANQMGPHAKNNLDPDASGALYNLDPREVVMWSDNSGSSWKFGEQVGWYDDDNGQGKVWAVGYRIAGGASVAHGWPFMNWPDDASGQSITYKNIAKAITFTHTGGANNGGSVGTVTVTNTTTGVSATTSSLGSGLVSGALSNPVPVAAGQSYTVKASGTTGMGSPGSGQGAAFKLGSQAPWNYSTTGSNGQVPMVFAAP